MNILKEKSGSKICLSVRTLRCIHTVNGFVWNQSGACSTILNIATYYGTKFCLNQSVKPMILLRTWSKRYVGWYFQVGVRNKFMILIRNFYLESVTVDRASFSQKTPSLNVRGIDNRVCHHKNNVFMRFDLIQYCIDPTTTLKSEQSNELWYIVAQRERVTPHGPQGESILCGQPPLHEEIDYSHLP